LWSVCGRDSILFDLQVFKGLSACFARVSLACNNRENCECKDKDQRFAHCGLPRVAYRWTAILCARSKRVKAALLTLEVEQGIAANSFGVAVDRALGTA
jgi:hypothetical protein